MRRFSSWKNLRAQQGADAALEDRHVARLADEVVGPGLQGPRHVLLVLAPGQHQHRDRVVDASAAAR